MPAEARAQDRQLLQPLRGGSVSPPRSSPPPSPSHRPQVPERGGGRYTPPRREQRRACEASSAECGAILGRGADGSVELEAYLGLRSPRCSPLSSAPVPPAPRAACARAAVGPRSDAPRDTLPACTPRPASATVGMRSSGPGCITRFRKLRRSRRRGTSSAVCSRRVSIQTSCRSTETNTARSGAISDFNCPGSELCNAPDKTRRAPARDAQALAPQHNMAGPLGRHLAARR